MNNNILQELLIQFNYINSEVIQKSFHYYLSLPQNDKKLILDYKSEMDSDDWIDKPLNISYNVINWILQHKSRILLYMPELLESGAITKEQFVDQIYNAEKLINILSSFPLISQSNNNNKGINVYRGDTNELCNYITNKSKNKQITLFSFLSTSLNLSVATNFSQGCLLCINIPTGNPLPFISDKLTMNYNTNINNNSSDTSESEVLLPLGCTFKLLDVYNNINVNGKTVNIFYLQLLTFGPHKTRNFWNQYVDFANNLYNKHTNLSIGGKNKRKRTICIKKKKKKKLVKINKKSKINKKKHVKTYKKYY